MAWLPTLIGPLSLAAGILLLLMVLAVLLWLTGKLEGYDPINEMLFRDNPALGVRYALFVLSVVFALLGIFDRAPGESGAWLFIQNAVLALVLIYLSRYLNDWLILSRFDNNREVVQQKNLAVAIVEGATYLASAFVIAGAFDDWESGRILAVAWFVIGQLLLIVLAWLYRLVDRDIDAALDGQNFAAGIALGSFLLAGGLVCGALVSGPSQGWRHDVLIVTIYLIVWIFLMLIAHILSDSLVFRSTKLRDELMQQRNIAAALCKAVIFLSVTLGYIHG